MKTMMMAMMMAAVLASSGCFSIYATKKHNEAAQARHNAVIRAAPLGDRGAALEVDLLNLDTGYFAAWGESPAMMATALAGDAALTALTIYGGAELWDALHETPPPDGPEKPEPPDVPTMQVSGETVTIVIGSGNTTTTSGSSAAPAEPAPVEPAP